MYRNVICPLISLVVSTTLANHNYAATEKTETSSPDIFSFSLEDLGNLSIEIATGTTQSLSSAPAVASVITSKDINALGARTLDDVLETIPGLHVSLSAVNRLDSVYSIRGIHTGFNPHVLLLLDGNPVQWTLQGGRPFLYRLPTNMIARIEVIRGPGSAIYGSDAFSGVINVITKSADDIGSSEIGLRSGSFETRDLWLNYGKFWRNWKLSASLNYMASKGDQENIVISDLQTGLDNLFSTSASLAPGPLAQDYEIFDVHLKANNRQWDINFWNWTSRNTGNGAGGAQALDPNSKEHYQSFFIDVSHTPMPYQGWEQSFNLTYYNHRVEGNLTLLPPNSLVPIGEDGNINFSNPAGLTFFTDGVIGTPSGTTEDRFIEWVANKTFLFKHQLRIAAGHRNQSLKSEESKNFGPGVLNGTQAIIDGKLTDVSDTQYVFVPNSERKITHLAIQDEWPIDRNWMLTAGVRFDHYSDFGTTTNPRIAMVWKTNSLLTTKLLYGSAFRAPSFGELNYQNNPTAIGNPNLEPETVDTWELVFHYRPNHSLESSFNLYRYKANRLIEFVPEAIGAVAQNNSRQNGEGVELEVKWQPYSSLLFSVSGAWQKSYNTATNESIADAPAKQLSLLANWEFRPQWFINAHTYWISGRQRLALDEREPIADYSRASFHLKRSNLIKGLDISLKVNNAFNSDAREPSNGTIAEDYPLAGRSYWFELKYSY